MIMKDDLNEIMIETNVREIKSEYDKKYYLRNKEKKKKREQERYLNNKQEILKKRKDYYLNNVEIIKEKRENYYEKNRNKILIYKKNYRKQNIDIINTVRLKKISSGYFKEYYKNKYHNDNLYKLGKVIRVLINDSIKKKGFVKKSKTSEILGCTFNEFKTYLELKFEPWMNWNNYGNWNGVPKEIEVSWDIDHIIPISSARTEEEMVRLNHYSNLQPLCSYANRYIKRSVVANY